MVLEALNRSTLLIISIEDRKEHCKNCRGPSIFCKIGETVQDQMLDETLLSTSAWQSVGTSTSGQRQRGAGDSAAGCQPSGVAKCANCQLELCRSRVLRPWHSRIIGPRGWTTVAGKVSAATWGASRSGSPSRRPKRPMKKELKLGRKWRKAAWTRKMCASQNK